MSETLTGGELIAKLLAAAGAEMAFGIISIHNIPIFDALSRREGFRVITSRSEPGAVNMADGFARASGKLGVAITSTGTGAGNAAGALVEAYTAGTPLLHLTGQIESAYLDQNRMFIHEAKDQLTMLKAVSKAAYRVNSAAELGRVVNRAIQEALAHPQGPVSVEIPIDLQRATVPDFPATPLAKTALPDQAALENIAEIMKTARRPLIWAGGGVIASGAHQELEILAEAWGAAVITSQAGRGAIPEDHPQCIGFFGNNPAAGDFIQSCDVLLAIGTKLRGQETHVWKLPLPPTIIQIDADPAGIGRNYPVTDGLVADAKPAISGLIKLIGGPIKRDPAFIAEAQSVREACVAKLRKTLGPYEQICDDIAASIAPETIMVRDVTIAANTWGGRLISAVAPRHSIHASGGGIGQGLQMAIGAKFARPDNPVVGICGDGGFMVNIGEMATAAQERVPVTVVLFNDGGYGVLRNIQDRSYQGRHFAVDLRSPDFGQLAKGFGWHYFKVSSAAQFKGCFDEALATNSPALVEVDMLAVGPYAVPFAGPPQAKY